MQRVEDSKTIHETPLFLAVAISSMRTEIISHFQDIRLHAVLSGICDAAQLVSG